MSNLEYIYSSPSFLKIRPTLEEWRQNEEICLEFSSIVSAGVKKIKEEVLKRYPLIVSILYNAFTESDFGYWIKKRNNLGFENVYADSGGLQAVFLGKKLDNSFKSKIYEIQSISDYSMCFDEIPCETVAVNITNKRKIFDNRIYVPEKADFCARKTSRNIINQIEHLVKLKSKSKVFFIVQGNTIEDMLRWFEIGISELDSWHWDYIGGVAIAGICAGLGTLESLDTLAAYHKICKEFDEKYVKSHLHLLGFGSEDRLKPVIYLNNNFIPDSTRISFDSTSLSRGFTFGKFIDESGKTVKSHYFNSKVLLTNIVDMFFPIINDYFSDLDKNDIIDYFYKDYMKPSNKILSKESIKMITTICSLRTLSIIWQTIGFSKKLQIIQENMFLDNSPIGQFQHIDNYDDYLYWRKTFSHFIPSKRIKRKRQVNIFEF